MTSFHIVAWQMFQCQQVLLWSSSGDSSNLASLMLLDLSTAFDTVLLQRLWITYGIDVAVCFRFCSYLSDHFQFQYVSQNRPIANSTDEILCSTGICPWSDIVWFLLYTANLVKLVESCGLSVHLYADVTPVYGFSLMSTVDLLQMHMSTCIEDVNWMSSNWLQLNANKTEMLWGTSTRRQNQLPASLFRVCRDCATHTWHEHRDILWAFVSVNITTQCCARL